MMLSEELLNNEIKRLQIALAEVWEENAAMRPIVEAVAKDATLYRDHEDEYCTQDANCLWRRPGPREPVQMVHTQRCIVTQARAILAKSVETDDRQPS